MTRRVLLITHTRRPDSVPQSRRLAERLEGCGFQVRVLHSQAAQLRLTSAEAVDERAARSSPRSVETAPSCVQRRSRDRTGHRCSA